jgi:hypothetical protein
MKISKGLISFFFLLMLLALGVTNSTLFVQATIYDVTINVNVSSPIQNKTYFTNDVPLSFSYDSNITNSPDVASYSVVFTYNIDGQPIFDMFGNTVFGGESTRIGQFYQPVPLWWSAPIHVPNGSHSLFVLITFWVRPIGENQNLFKVHNVSQVVNFTVSAGTPTSTPSPSPTTTESPSPTPSPTSTTTLEPTQTPMPEPAPLPTTIVIGIVAAVVVIGVGLFVYFKKLSKSEAKT